MPTDSDQAVLVTLLLHNVFTRFIFLFEELRKVVAATTATITGETSDSLVLQRMQLFCVTMDMKTTVLGSTISNTAHSAKTEQPSTDSVKHLFHVHTMTKWSLHSLSACTHHLVNHICDRIRENPPHAIRAQFVQCTFLLTQVQTCPIHVKQPFFCYCLRRLVMSYKGKINLHFDPPSLYSCHVRSPLLREIIRICTRYSWIRSTTVCSLIF